MPACEHPWLRWDLYPINEAGWVCRDCDHKPGEPPGFSPQADRQHTDEKVSAILFWLHSHDLVYVSNGDTGVAVTAAVVKRCHLANMFDQLSIVAFLVEALNKAALERSWDEDDAKHGRGPA